MRVEVVTTGSLINIRISQEDILIFVDALRAGNTIISLFDAGARKVIPIAHEREIKTLISKRKNKNRVFIGERYGIKLDFCDFGNSPTEIAASRNKIKNKIVFMTTSNMTRILDLYKRYKCYKAVGTLLNIESMKDFILKKDIRKVFVIPVGRKRHMAAEDNKTAFYIRNYLINGTNTEIQEESLRNCYYNSASGRNLLGLHYGKDIDICSTLNGSDTLPLFTNDSFVKWDGI